MGSMGLAVDFFSIATIADRIDEVFDHPDRMQQLRHRARETAVCDFDLKTRQLPGWEALVADIVAGRRPALDLDDDSVAHRRLAGSHHRVRS